HGCREVGKNVGAVFPRVLTSLEERIDDIVGRGKWIGTTEERNELLSGGPAKAKAIAQAAEKLLTASASPIWMGARSMLCRIISIGPWLWTGVTSVQVLGGETIQTFALVNQDTVARWKLSPADLDSLAGTSRETVAGDAKHETPVMTGTIVRRTREILPAMVLARAGPGAFPFSIRRPSEAELEYVRSVSPFELSEPLFVLESGSK